MSENKTLWKQLVTKFKWQECIVLSERSQITWDSTDWGLYSITAEAIHGQSTELQCHILAVYIYSVANM